MTNTETNNESRAQRKRKTYWVIGQIVTACLAIGFGLGYCAGSL